MSLRFLGFVVLCAAVVSCSKDKADQPPLSRDQMADVMMSIYLAEARTTLMPISKDSAYRLFLPYQDSLLHHRGIADSTLKKAYAYYLKHPAEFEAIYDVIIDSLSLREQRRRDSPHIIR